MLSCASVLHCENPLKVEEDWIKDYDLKNGDYDVTAVDKELASIIPLPLDMGAVYQRLIRDTLTSKEDFVDGIIRAYNNEICEVIDNYNCSAFYPLGKNTPTEQIRLVCWRNLDVESFS